MPLLQANPQLNAVTLLEELQRRRSGEYGLLYRFALAHSGRRSSNVVEGGESFQALSTGLQSAL